MCCLWRRFFNQKRAVQTHKICSWTKKAHNCNIVKKKHYYLPVKQGAISNFVVPWVNLERLGNHSNQTWKKKHSKTVTIMITIIYCNYNPQPGLQSFQTEAAVHQITDCRRNWFHFDRRPKQTISKTEQLLSTQQNAQQWKPGENTFIFSFFVRVLTWLQLKY